MFGGSTGPPATKERAIIFQALIAAAILGTVCFSAHAAPLTYNSHVRAVGTVNGGGTGGSGLQEDTDKRNLFVMTKNIDDVGNESFDSASLGLDAGLATAVTHACSGGSPTFGGSATAGGFVDFNQIYQLTSSTFPLGTLLSVHFQFASAARIIASGTDLDFFNDSGGSGARVALSLATTEFTPTTLVNVNGGVSRGYSYPNVESENRSGNYEPDGGHGEFDFMLAVGANIRLSVAADATAGSTALGSGAIDGDSQPVPRLGLRRQR